MIELEYAVTAATDQMMVGPLLHPLIGEITATHIRFRDQPHGTQRGERTVDGRNVNIRVSGAYLLEDLSGGQMALRMAQRRQHHEPLGRQLHLGAAQHRNGVCITTHATAGFEPMWLQGIATAISCTSGTATPAAGVKEPEGGGKTG